MSGLLRALLLLSAFAFSSHASGDEAIDKAMATAIILGDERRLDAAMARGGNADTTIYIQFNDSEAPLSLLTMATLLGDRKSLNKLRKAGARIGDSCDVSYLMSVIEPLNTILPRTRARAVFANIFRSQSELKCYLHTPYRLDIDKLEHELMLAITQGDLAAVRNVLSAGVDKNAREAKLRGHVTWPGRTALMIAMLEGKRDLATFIVQEGADLNAQASVGSTWGGWDGFSALMLATQLYWPEFVDTLLKSGADPMLSDDDGAQAVHHAAASGKVLALKYLLNSAASSDAKRQMMNARTAGGDTPLALAARGRHVEAAHYLADQGIALFGPAYLGNSERSALMESAIHRGYRTEWPEDRSESSAAALEILTLFLDRGADPNTADDQGVTLLMSAVRDGLDLAVIELLLKKGAKPLQSDKSGKTASQYSENRKDVDAVTELLARYSGRAR